MNWLQRHWPRGRRQDTPPGMVGHDLSLPPGELSSDFPVFALYQTEPNRIMAWARTAVGNFLLGNPAETIHFEVLTSIAYHALQAAPAPRPALTPENTARMALCMAKVFAERGIPVAYYPSEVAA